MKIQNPKKLRRKMMTTTISLTEDVHRKLKYLAVDRSIPVRDLIREAIEEYLKRAEREKSSSGSSHLG